MTDQHLGGASHAAPSAGQADHPLLEALDATLHIPAWTSGDDDAAGAAASSFGAGVEGSGGGAATPSEDKPRRRRRTTTRKKAAKSSDEETEAPSADPEGADGAPADDDGEGGSGRKRRRRGSRGGRRRKRSDDDAVEIDAIPGEDDDLGASASDSDEEEAPRRKKKRATKKARRSKAAAEPEDADAESSPDPDDAEAEDGEEDGGRKKKRRRRRSRRKSKASGDEEDDEAAEEPADDEPASRSKRKKKATKAKRATKTAEEKAAEAEALRTNTILVNAVEPEERRVAVVDGDRIIDFLMNAESQKTLVNDIYRGRVVNLEPAIGAAFIDFGQGRNGFLHTSDVLPVYGDDDFRIDDLLKAGIHDEEGDHDADWSEEADALDDIAEEIADVDDLEDEDHEVEEPSEDSEEPREKSKRKRTRRTAKKADPEPAEESEPADEGEPAGQDEDDAPKARTRRKRTRGGRRGKAEPAEQTADEAADGDPGTAAPAEAEEAPSAPRFGLLPDPDPAPSDGDGEDGESVAPKKRTLRTRRKRPTSSLIVSLDGDGDGDGGGADDRGESDGAAPARKKRSRSRKKASTAKKSKDEGEGEAKAAKKASKKKAAKKKASKKKASSKKAASKKKEPKSRRSGGSKSGRGRGGRGQRERRTQRERRPIDQLLKVGDPVVVQVTKDAIGDKGPTLTTYISMPGRYLVLMPSMSRTGVSRKIPDEKERKRLKRILASMNTPKDMGVIVRTAGVGRTKADLQRDLDYLLGLWESFGEKLTASRGPAPLYLESDVATRTLRDLFDRRTKEVIVDDFSVYEQMVGFAKALMPEHVDRIKRHEGDRPLFQHAGLEQDFERIFARRVDLPSGGSVVFDQAEALVAIDVNSGRTRADTYDFEDIALKTNLEAVPEIARQIKLRDLGGIIVCDFIDMMRSASNRQVEKALRTALADDRARAKIGRISQFGLLELTRQRLGPGTHKKVFQACPRCRGTGRIRSVESRAQAILRRLGGAVVQKGFSRVEVRAHPEVVQYLKEDLWDWVRAMEHRSEKEIVLTEVPDQPEDSVLRYLRADGREVRPGGRRKR